jgi:hypothetical protein
MGVWRRGASGDCVAHAERGNDVTQDLDALRRDLTSRIWDAERPHGIPTQSVGTSYDFWQDRCRALPL